MWQFGIRAGISREARTVWTWSRRRWIEETKTNRKKMIKNDQGEREQWSNEYFPRVVNPCVVQSGWSELILSGYSHYPVSGRSSVPFRIIEIWPRPRFFKKERKSAQLRGGSARNRMGADADGAGSQLSWLVGTLARDIIIANPCHGTHDKGSTTLRRYLLDHCSHAPWSFLIIFFSCSSWSPLFTYTDFTSIEIFQPECRSSKSKSHILVSIYSC